MSEETPVVFIVDDDPSVRRSVGRLLAVAGYRVQSFSSAQEFLSHESEREPGCLILDVRLPDLNGFELQQALMQRDSPLPIVFITGHGDIPLSVKAMKAGAVDFLPKPFAAEALLDAVALALEKGRKAFGKKSEMALLRARLSVLSPRETEVFRHVASGKLNKQIASELGIAEKTVKVHRGRVMTKLKVESLAELVRLAEKAKSF